MSIIPVVVVESHQHVLEHIHYVLRRKRMLEKEWSMMHFDAHPDLSCLHFLIPATACYQPRRKWVSHDERQSTETENENDEQDNESGKDLYELLDSTATGIAEWILPLVLAANLTRVIWIRPVTSELPQLPLGNHVFNVGAWIPSDYLYSKIPQTFLDLPVVSRVKVDWNCPYYVLDDVDSFAPTNELLLSKPLQLCVAELNSSSQTLPRCNTPWMLDICLDYFACFNPFLSELEEMDAAVAHALVDCVHQSSFYKANLTDTTINSCDCLPNASRTDLAIFRKLLSDLLNAASSLSQSSARVTESLDRSSLIDTITNTSSMATISLDTVIESLTYFYCPHPSKGYSQKILRKLVNAIQFSTTNELSKLLTLAIESIPNLTMPHDTATTTSSASCKSIAEPIIGTLDRMRDELLLHLYTKNEAQQVSTQSLPFMITVCRSASDGFTPMSLVDELQEKVLSLVHECYCSCGKKITLASIDDEMKARSLTKQVTSNEEMMESSIQTIKCCLEFLFDYDLWEGSSLEAFSLR